jgi:hypothetical protein
MVWKQTIFMLFCMLSITELHFDSHSIITWETLLIVCHVNFLSFARFIAANSLGEPRNFFQPFDNSWKLLCVTWVTVFWDYFTSERRKKRGKLMISFLIEQQTTKLSLPSKAKMNKNPWSSHLTHASKRVSLTFYRFLIGRGREKAKRRLENHMFIIILLTVKYVGKPPVSYVVFMLNIDFQLISDSFCNRKHTHINRDVLLAFWLSFPSHRQFF